MKGIKVLKLFLRICWIAAALIGIMLAFQRSWSDAIYAIVMAFLIGSYEQRVGRRIKKRDEHQAG